MEHKDKLSVRHVRPSLHAAIQLYANKKGITMERAILDALSVEFEDIEKDVLAAWGRDEQQSDQTATSE